jgi:hypothetical protein
VPSAFLVNAGILFAGVIAFILAGFAGTFSRRVQPWRYRLLLAPLGFVVMGGISISAEAHLVRWIQHGHLQHSLMGGLLQSVTLLLAGSAGLLAGLGLGASIDCSFPDGPTYFANWAIHRTSGDCSDKVVPISAGRKQPAILPQVKAVSQND